MKLFFIVSLFSFLSFANEFKTGPMSASEFEANEAFVLRVREFLNNDIKRMNANLLECLKKRNEYPNQTFFIFVKNLLSEKLYASLEVYKECGFENTDLNVSLAQVPLKGLSLDNLRKKEFRRLLANRKYCQDQIISCEKDLITGESYLNSGREVMPKIIEDKFISDPSLLRYLKQ
jgi:hypothetical protein